MISFLLRDGGQAVTVNADERAGIACSCTSHVSTGEEGDEGPLYCTTCLPDETGSFPDGMSRAADAFTGADRLVAMTITTSKPGEPDR